MENRRTLIIAAMKLQQELLRTIKSLTIAIVENLDSDSEDEEFLKLGAIEADGRIRPNQRNPPRLYGYSELIVPQFYDGEFRSHFRLHPATANQLENKISKLLLRHGGVGRQTILPRKQILAVLWLLATPDSYRSIGQKFGMSKSSLHHCFRRVYLALNELTPQIIYWPTSSEKLVIKQRFQEMAGLPDVIGAIDGCHIEIDAPEEQPAAYRTGKKKYAIQLQAVCTSDLIFTDVFAGYPGSVNDARVFKNSPLYRDATKLFEGNEYILGDKAYYPVLLWCIPPYKNFGNLSLPERNFNEKLSKTRQVIERAFALLKGRFRRLKHLAMFRTDEIAPTILASCALHNLCLRSMHESQQDIESFISEGQNQENENAEVNQDDYINEQSSTAALSKRDYLKNLVTNSSVNQ